MLERTGWCGTLFCIALLGIGCSSPSGPADQPPAAAPAAKPEPTGPGAAVPAPSPESPAATPGEMPAQPVAAVEPAPAEPAPAPSTPAAAASPPPQAAAPPQPARAPTEPVSAPAPAAAPAPVPAPAAAPAAATPAVVDVGGAVAVAATRPGLTRVGSDTCEMCHEVQFTSWAGTAHAKRTPPLDCEGCHGPGSGYKTMAVMKDPAKARAAGLVIPELSFCSQCHVKGATNDLLRRAHAHEDDAG